MSRENAAWVDVLATTLRHLPERLFAGEADRQAAYRCIDFKRVCDEIEEDLVRAGVQPSHSEWQATKFIMKSIYKKTKSAHRNGYDFYQYALTPHLADPSLKGQVMSPTIQRGVELWCSLLGWSRASIVNWTSVEAAIAQATASRYPYSANEFAVRLEGLGKQPALPGREIPRPQPITLLGTGVIR